MPLIGLPSLHRRHSLSLFVLSLLALTVLSSLGPRLSPASSPYSTVRIARPRGTAWDRFLAQKLDLGPTFAAQSEPTSVQHAPQQEEEEEDVSIPAPEVGENNPAPLPEAQKPHGLSPSVEKTVEPDEEEAEEPKEPLGKDEQSTEDLEDGKTGDADAGTDDDDATEDEELPDGVEEDVEPPISHESDDEEEAAVEETAEEEASEEEEEAAEKEAAKAGPPRKPAKKPVKKPGMTKAPKPKTLPVCSRTLVFRLASLHGLTSETWILLRVAVLASHHKYTVIVDSSQWNYGPIDTYFRLPTLKCTPPPTTEKRVTMLTEGWEEAPHVEWKRDVNKLDAALMELFPTQPKPGDNALVPGAYMPVFRALEKEVRRWWVLTPELEKLAALYEEEEEKAFDESVIGLHVRLGDKFLEIGAPEQGLYSDLLTSYITAIEFLSPLDPTTLLVLSDDPNAWEAFEADKRIVSSGWNVVPIVTPSSPLLPTGFNETTFNALPLSTRVELTKPFVASLTALAHAPQLVMSASSNVGRLLALLAGSKAVRAGDVVSIDTQWFPTARQPVSAS